MRNTPYARQPVRTRNSLRHNTGLTGMCVRQNSQIFCGLAALFIPLTHLGGLYHMEMVKTAENRRSCHMKNRAVANFEGGCVRHPLRPHP